MRQITRPEKPVFRKRILCRHGRPVSGGSTRMGSSTSSTSTTTMSCIKTPKCRGCGNHPGFCDEAKTDPKRYCDECYFTCTKCGKHDPEYDHGQESPVWCEACNGEDCDVKETEEETRLRWDRIRQFWTSRTGLQFEPYRSYWLLRVDCGLVKGEDTCYHCWGVVSDQQKKTEA